MACRFFIRTSLVGALACLPLATACSPSETSGAPIEATGEAKAQLGLMTTLPILWSGNGDFADILAEDAQQHWALGVLSEKHEVAALDTLSRDTLSKTKLLVLAQPRMLSGEENVALDSWVREGGHVLIFADPMLTEHSEYGIGDKRRPQDVALLDTILARWGLTLTPTTPRLETVFARLGDAELPLRGEGYFTRRDPAGGAQADCEDRLGPTLVSCAIGKGRAVILADAAVLEAGHGSDHGANDGSADALRALLGIAGETPQSRYGNSGK